MSGPKKPRLGAAATARATPGQTAARRARWVWFAFRYVSGLKRKDLATHRALVCRFWAHWDELERVTWTPLQEEAKRRGARTAAFARGSSIGGDLVLLGLVLEAAYRWAAQLDTGRVDAVRGARDEVAALDASIRETAQRLNAALERRAELFEQLGIESEWTTERGEPVDIEDYSDAVDLLASAQVTPPESRFPEDRETLRVAQGERSGRAADVRRFFASIDSAPALGWTDLATGSRSTALDCMTADGISALLCVAAGDDYHDPINTSLGVEAISKALQRYRRRAKQV